MNLIKLAKELRKNSTDAERLLWSYLRRRQMLGLKFRRQETLGRYIVDFVCLEKKLIIECDGGQHMSQEVTDGERDRFFIEKGYNILRFWNHDVLKRTREVLENIYYICSKIPSP